MSRHAVLPRRLHRHFIAVAIACLLSPALAWAEDGPVLPLAADDRAQLEKMLGKDVIVTALPARPLLAAMQYLPKASGKLVFRVTERGKKPRDEIHTVTKLSQAGAVDSFQYDRTNEERMVFTTTENGGASITKDYDLEKQVISTFTPPQPLIIPGLAPGQSQNVKIAVAVADMDDPNNVSYRGSLDVSCINLGRFKVKVPAGTYDADLIKWTFAGDIGPASVETSQYRFLSEGNGMVAMVQWRSISAMLIYHEKSLVGRVLSKVE